jgi:hypothetical protein
MASNRKASGLLLFNLIFHEVSAINHRLSAERQLPVEKLRAFAKNEIFPHYQGTPEYKIRKGELRTFIEKTLKQATKPPRYSWQSVLKATAQINASARNPLDLAHSSYPGQ